MRLLAILLMAVMCGCVSKRDDLIEVKVVAVIRPHTEGSGLSKTYYFGGCVYESKSGERFFSQKELGTTGETFRVREGILRK